jgi:hypothetical protein
MQGTRKKPTRALPGPSLQGAKKAFCFPATSLAAFPGGSLALPATLESLPSLPSQPFVASLRPCPPCSYELPLATSHSAGAGYSQQPQVNASTSGVVPAFKVRAISSCNMQVPTELFCQHGWRSGHVCISQGKGSFTSHLHQNICTPQFARCNVCCPLGATQPWHVDTWASLLQATMASHSLPCHHYACSPSRYVSSLVCTKSKYQCILTILLRMIATTTCSAGWAFTPGWHRCTFPWQPSLGHRCPSKNC